MIEKASTVEEALTDRKGVSRIPLNTPISINRIMMESYPTLLQISRDLFMLSGFGGGLK